MNDGTAVRPRPTGGRAKARRDSLAIDLALNRRWVVLKGLLDTGDQDAMAAAISERRFLSQIEHANKFQ